MNIIHKARAEEIQRHQQRVFLCWHQANAKERDKLIENLLSHDAGADCVVSWIEDPAGDIDETLLRQELRETQLFVFIVTVPFLQKAKNEAPPEFRIAEEMKENLPRLPVATDATLFSMLTAQEHVVHGIAMDDSEYRTKLKAQLDNFIAPDELIKEITEKAFTGWLFFSYRKKDIDCARAFMKAFHDVPGFESIAVWYDNFLTAGRIFRKEIFSSIDTADVFVLLVTPNLLEKNDVGEPNYVISEELPYAIRTGKKIVAVEVVETDTGALRDIGIAGDQIIHFTEYIKLRENSRKEFFSDVDPVSVLEKHNYFDLLTGWEKSFSEKTSKYLQPLQNCFSALIRQRNITEESKTLLSVAYAWGIYVEQDITRAVMMMHNRVTTENAKLFVWMLKKIKIRAMTDLPDQEIAMCDNLIKNGRFVQAHAIASRAFKMYNETLTDRHPKTQSAKELILQIENKMAMTMGYKDKKNLVAHIAYYSQKLTSDFWLATPENSIVYDDETRTLLDYKGDMPPNTSLSVKIPTRKIATGAFKDKKNLVSITIPECVDAIANDAFEGCENLTIFATPDSVAAQYAEKHGIPCANPFKPKEKRGTMNNILKFLRRPFKT